MIALMCKDPVLGKRRLALALGDDVALGLARAFLADGAALAAEVAARCDTLPVAFAAGEVALPGWEIRPQAEGDLGARMGAAASGGPTLLLGTDAPTLPPALAELAWSALRNGADAAVVPALDGGYCALAMARPWPALLDAMPWSTPMLLESTRERAAAAGLNLAVLPAWHDVDEAADLALLRLTLAGAAPEGCSVLPPFGAPATRLEIDRLAAG